MRSLQGRWEEAEAFVAPPRSEWPVALRRARAVGFVLLGVQFLAFCWWSSVLTHRFALTWDFAAYEQAASLIGHGHLDPYSTVLSARFVRNDYEFLIWLIAPLQRIWPHPMTLKLLQVLALVASELIALDWMSDIAAVRAKQEGRAATAVALVALGILLLVVNPWIVWTVSFDVHMEPFLTLFVIAAARDLFRGRRRAWLWVVCALLCGAASVAYIGALGISAAVNGRRWWRQGVAMLVLAIVWTLGMQVLIGANSNGLGVYSYILDGNSVKYPKHVTGGLVLAAALKHPGRDVSVLWGNAVNIWSNLSPAGLIGLFWLPFTIPIVAVTLLSGFTASIGGFSTAGFQNVALEVFVALGTVAVCSAIARRYSSRRRWVLPSVLAILAVNAVVWAVIWVPQTAKRWMANDTSKSSQTLSDLRDRMRPGDEVVVENGVAGGFAENRKSVFVIQVGSVAFPVRSRRVWVVFAPAVGIEIRTPVASIYSDISELARKPGMRLVTSSNGIWAFEWNPPAGTKWLRIGPPTAVSPAWVLPGPGGSAVKRGKAAAWFATSTGKPGYVVAHGYARELPGTYRAAVTLSTSGFANVELWDATTSTLLARRSLTGTHGTITVQLSSRVLHTPGFQAYAGWGPWSITPIPSPPGDNLEIRVWQPGGKDRVRVYSTALAKVSART